MSEDRRKRQDLLQARHGALYTEVSQLLREADPIRLITIGAPDDEYDPEVSTILPRLRGAQSAAEVRKIIHEEFVHWFDADIAGPVTHYAEVAEKVWGVWLTLKERS
ncbi:MAG: hypothetical protein HYZ50_20700 [Deltaproteobacteria bacterium]|nr:hypothetical protein [Deltaproteobacteria bacterium]